MRLLLLLLASMIAPAQAGLVKCKSASGGITYTDTACPAGTSAVEPPADVTPGSSGAPEAAASSAKRLSPKALAFKQQMNRCMATDDADPGCEALNISFEMCKDKANWQTPLCVAFRDAADALREEQRAPGAQKLARSRTQCAQGVSYASTVSACPPELYADGSDDEVRA